LSRAAILAFMSKRFIHTLSVLSLVIALAGNGVALAAKPGGGGKGPTTTTLGYDVSHPQCGTQLPSGQAFGIVGVNGGTAAKPSPCLPAQLNWAATSTGSITAQAKTQLYVNTANPGQVMDQMSTPWPTSNSGVVTNPYGTCTGANDSACSWEYGWGRADYAADEVFVPAATSAGLDADVSHYLWWLDVETGNTWQTGTADAYANNVATLEGESANFQYRGAKVGLYSTAYQWGQITGNLAGQGGNLIGLDNWRPGGANLRTAKQACSADPLTPNGRVVLTQFVSKNLDNDYSCI